MSIIRALKLSEEDVLLIINEWYTNGMCIDTFQNEAGEELDEWCEDRVQKIKYYVCGNIIYLRFTFVNIFIVWLYCTLVCCSIWKTANS